MILAQPVSRPEGPNRGIGRLLARLNDALTPRRMAYSWIIAPALWAAWLVSVGLGSGRLDRFGQAIGADYAEFYAAGAAVRRGEAGRLYDISYMASLERELVDGRLERYYAFLTPPFAAVPYVALSRLPYLASFIVWTLLSLTALWVGVRLVVPLHRRSFFAYAITFFPVFASLTYGQNALVSVAILAAVYRLWRVGAPVAAGAAASLLDFKPQLLIGLVLWWSVERGEGWRALAGLAIGTATIVGATLVMMPDASRAYAALAANVLPDLPRWLHFPLWNLHTVRGFWRLLLPGWVGLTDLLWILVAMAILVEAARTWLMLRRRRDMLFAGAVLLTILLTPHAMIYDWALLVIPAALLWYHAEELRSCWRPLFALVWLGTIVSGPLTQAQLRGFGWALQISVPVLVAVTWWAARLLRAREALRRAGADL